MQEIERRAASPVMVNVNMGFKRNVGNYESMNINVGITAPAKQGESAPEAFTRVYEFVEQQLLEKFAETEAELRKRGLGEE